MLKIDSNTGRLVDFLASGGYAGYSPVAPGTAGSIAGLLLYIPFSALSTAAYAVVLSLLICISVYIAGKAEAVYGRKDCQVIVIDEIAGIFVTMFLSPPTMLNLAGGFLLFRVFDIIKPFPADWADKRLKGGSGVVMDDVVAGIYANIALHFTNYLLR